MRSNMYMTIEFNRTHIMSFIVFNLEVFKKCPTVCAATQIA